MPSYPASFDHMLAAWNETDPQKIRSHLDLALSPQVEFVDPTIITRGIDQFEANVREFRETYPKAVCTRTSKFDSHHRLYRYTWEIKNGNDLIVHGFDVAELDDASRVLRVLGYFWAAPSAGNMSRESQHF
jgi:hypothetical protein